MLKKAALLAFVLSCAYMAHAQTTQILASNISYFGDGSSHVTGRFCLTPTDQVGNQINLETSAGQQFAQTSCFAITNGVLANNAIVPDTALSQPVNACLKLRAYDSTNALVASYNCLQPTGATWSFDTFVPTTLPNIAALTAPQFQLNGSTLANQRLLNFICPGCTYTNGSLTLPTGGSGSISIAANTILGNNTGSTANAFALTPTQLASMLASFFDASGTATNASNLSSGTVPAARLPLATSGAFGAVKVDGTTVTATNGVISAVGTGGYTGAQALVVATPAAASGTAGLRALVSSDIPSLPYDASGAATSAQAAAQAASLPRTTFTVGTGGVTANRIVSFDSSGNAIAATGVGFGGLAAATVAATGTVEVVRSGLGTCTFDGAAVINDIVVASTTTTGECHDSGQTSSQQLPASTAVVGVVEATVSGAGINGTVRLHGPGSVGAQPALGVFYAKASDTIASIEAECSSPCNYIVTIPQTFTLAASHTLASNVNVVGTPTGSWTVNGVGFTLTISGLGYMGPLAPFFVSGTGAIAGLSTVYPENFGAISSSATIPAAIAACTVSPCNLVIGLGRYNFSAYNDTTPLATSNLVVSGAKMPVPNSTTTPTQLVNGSILYPSCTFTGSNLYVHDLGCDNGSATTGTAADVLNFVSYNANSALAPGAVTATPSTTGGTLAAATYYYVVTATNALGQTTGSIEATATTTGTTSSVALSWSAITNATGYVVYRGTHSGGQTLFYTTATNSYTDTNATSTAGIVPIINTTGATGQNLTLKNLASLGNSTTAAFHNVKVEGYSGVTAENIWTYRNIDGMVLKTTNSTVTNYHGRGHQLACLYLKSESYASSVNNSVANITCNPEVAGDTQNALIVQASTAPTSGNIISNLAASGTASGLNLIGAVSTPNSNIAGFTLNGASFSQLSGFAITPGGYVGAAQLNDISVTNSGGWMFLTSSTEPHLNGIQITNSTADATTNSGSCASLGAALTIYNSSFYNAGGCAAAFNQGPIGTWTAAINATVPLTQNAVFTGSQWIPMSPVRVIGIDVWATTPANCTGAPVMYVYDISAAQRTAQVIFVNASSNTTTGTAGSGSTALTVASATGLATGQTVSGTGIAPGSYVSALTGTAVTLSIPTTAALSSTSVTFVGGTNYHSATNALVVPAGHVISLEAQANATCTTTPVINATVQYQSL